MGNKSQRGRMGEGCVPEYRAICEFDSSLQWKKTRSSELVRRCGFQAESVGRKSEVFLGDVEG